MKCYSCLKQKNGLSAKNSELLHGITIMMCVTCIESKLEPRWIVVMAARAKGADSVRDFIVKRRYLGKEILANELIA